MHAAHIVQRSEAIKAEAECRSQETSAEAPKNRSFGYILSSF